MRHYNPDSPQAVARVVAAALLADGGIDSSELKALAGSTGMLRLGMMSVEEFDRVVQDFCGDIDIVVLRDHAGQLTLDRAMIDQLLADIRAPELQTSLMGILLDVVRADGHLSAGEMTLVSQAMTRWGLELHAISGHRAPIPAPPRA
ncbi:MAG: hypothetical protein ACOH2B_02100 [Burkholderiaceae bacterium]